METLRTLCTWILLRHLTGIIIGSNKQNFGLCEKVVRWISSYLMGRTYTVQVAGALSQESGSSQGSVIGTSKLFVCQRPPECHQCDNAAFSRRRQDGHITPTKRPFAGFTLQSLEMVGNFGPIYPSHQMQLYRSWASSSTSIACRTECCVLLKPP